MMANGFRDDLRHGGLALQALGAGLRGNLEQFQAAQRQDEMMRQQIAQQQAAQQREQDDARRQALFQDAAVLHDHLKNGRSDAALRLVSERRQLLDQLGSDDPSDTQAVLGLPQQGNTDEGRLVYR